jgi:hypothetical protein
VVQVTGFVRRRQQRIRLHLHGVRQVLVSMHLREGRWYRYFTSKAGACDSESSKRDSKGS